MLNTPLAIAIPRMVFDVLDIVRYLYFSKYSFYHFALFFLFCLHFLAMAERAAPFRSGAGTVFGHGENSRGEEVRERDKSLSTPLI